MWVIEDELHAELIGEFPSQEDALVELRRLAEVPWDQSPNQAPCTSWQTCGRNYELVEYDVSSAGTWSEHQRIPALNVRQEAVSWLLS
jgi:hypothetical protein